ncbi:hypothetical protein ACFYV7_39455 [Nocardia suismassiliense]|uniref:Uncharacterized protein n=1 Tax=Nocardia suismassiliense TaxID=2077092 RepID=A0ABW6R761_9NOCA
MQLDQINTRAGELAAQFGLPSPRVKAGKVPAGWFPSGMWTRPRMIGPVVLFGPAFDDLSPQEQEGVLSVAVVSMAVVRKELWKAYATLTLLVLSLLFVMDVVDDLGVPGRLVFAVGMAVYLVSAVQLNFMWSHHWNFEIDVRVAGVMGRPLADAVIDLDDRQKVQRRGLFGAFLNQCEPSKAQRVKRLDAVFGRPQTASTP